MAKKGGLGRGLEALIPGENGVKVTGMTYLPTERVLPNPRQPRAEVEDASLAELAESIREHGVLQPLIVSAEPGSEDYILIAGERRLRAARMAGLTQVPAIVRQVSDQERLELALIENIQRADLSPLETAEAYQQLAEEFGMHHDEIAARVGKSREAVSNTLRLLKLPPEAKDALRSGQISEGHARALLSLEDHPAAQVSALKTILEHRLSVRQAEELVKMLKGERPPPKPPKAAPPENTANEESLRGYLGTRVALRHGKGGGSVVIYYFSDEELNSLLSKIIKD